MSTAADWVATRVPEPPAPLTAALRASLTAEDGSPSGGGAAAVAVALSEAGRRLLEHAIGRPGRDRESAYRLLEADALITYACEAALDTDDPEAALLQVLASAAR